MASSGGGDDLRAKRKKVMAELVKGKGIAVRLKTLIESRDWELGRGNDVVLAKDLSVQIVRSFNRILSPVNSGGNPPAAHGGNPPAAHGGDRGKKKPSDVKRRRGCYKRRKNLESYVTESPTAQDEYAWRKYGQKTILNSQHPRCYYRCKHKSNGCKARKQVQMIKDCPIAYLVTYLNHHTCSTNNVIRATYGNNPIANDSSTIFSFETETCQQNETCSSNNNANHNSTNPEIVTPSNVKVKEDADYDDQSNEGANFSDDTKSTAPMDPWQGFGSDHKSAWGHDPLPMFESGFGHHQSCESTSLLQYGYDDVDEVNQIGDIDMIYFDQELI